MREVLCFVKDGCASVVMDCLEERGWKIRLASELDEAKHAVADHDFFVGLIYLENFTSEILPPLENLILGGTNMEWLLVFPKSCKPVLESMSFCQFITENFFDYHTLPIDGERLSNSLGHAYGKATLKRRSVPENSSSGQLLGKSPVMRKLYRQLDKIRNVDIPVLICGESGTGKELVARMIHRNSARAKAPCVAVNCGALPAELIQSELFGHEKGAFTGAHEHKPGKLEVAQNGTVFLDEIGDFPLNLQTNLLRFLQEKTIERVGSCKSLRINVRVIAATNVDLEQAVMKGTFREDLYYRLNVLRINLPPLRERTGDVELLAAAVLKQFSREHKVRNKSFSQQALRAMSNYSWPGNVRELINRVQMAAVMSEKHLICPKDLGLDSCVASDVSLTLDQARQQAENEVVRNSLISNGNNVSEAAKQLGISRVTLYRLMTKLQIDINRASS